MSKSGRDALRMTSSESATPTVPSGSQTVLQTIAGPRTIIGTLRLRAEPQERRHIQWAEDVVDNEGMGKKSSKVCCIYHKPHGADDSVSDSSSSSSSSDSDSEPDLSRARRAGGKDKDRRSKYGHDDKHSHDGNDRNQRKRSPNAYERQPKYKGKAKAEG